jgi:CRP/FNR family transcriptional regulator
MELEGDEDQVESSFIGSLAPDVRERLMHATRQVEYEPGSAIREPGTTPRPGLVLEGLLRAYVVASDGREATVKYARSGDQIGMGGALGLGSPLGLQAVEATTILYFDHRRFEHSLATEATVARAVAEDLARALTRSSIAVRSFAFGHVRQRVATHLLYLATRDRHGRLVARVTQQGLADAAGSVRDVVARALAGLFSAGLVLPSRGKVLITDEEGLREEAGIP